MSQLIYLKSIADLSRLLNENDFHPLVAVVDFSKTKDHIEEETRITTDFYSVMFKNYCKSSITYGRKAIDFNEGSLICMAPNQVITIDNEIEPRENPMGWGLFFHPDLIRNTSLNAKMKDYSFFSYEIAEALHLSEKEKQLLFECIVKIKKELKENIDDYSQTIIVSTIELLLNYCNRFYGRQFITRKATNRDILEKIETQLKQHFSAKTNSIGLPTVKYLADLVNLSPGYLGDLLKKETGLNAQEHIHQFIIEEAKNILLNSNQSVSEIAFHLGFEYPQYFSRLFKQKTGKTPMEYRNLN
ncbi:MAG: helix-turn-helix domain-containing protein [Crocinitomicaceae bacterium]|jgi:AraC-like DNA-binding protein